MIRKTAERLDKNNQELSSKRGLVREVPPNRRQSVCPVLERGQGLSWDDRGRRVCEYLTKQGKKTKKGKKAPSEKTVDRALNQAKK